MATHLVTHTHVATDQLVFTYQDPAPPHWPWGVLTGHRRDEGWQLQHVIVFPQAPPGTLLPMLKAGLAYAWEQRWAYVLLTIPHALPTAEGLKVCAKRVGGIEYHVTDEWSHWVIYAP
jgi:hypothetical protein